MLPNLCAQIAQLVEQRTENPRVAGSIPALGIFYYIFLLTAGQKKPGHLFITFFRFFISLFILSSTNFRGIIF